MINLNENDIISTWNTVAEGVPLVSVWMLVYNHEKTLEQAVDSILVQKTSFPFQICIHDDCSTDQSASIMRIYENKYPRIVKCIYEIENQYSKEDGSLSRIMEETIHTKYTALCEGDDFWIDTGKLEKQINFMEKNPDCIMTLHNGYLYDDSQKRIAEKLNPYRKEGYLADKELLLEKGKLPPTASVVYLTATRKKMPKDIFAAPVGDRPLRMFFLTKGRIYYFNDCMCCYRVKQGEKSDSFDSRVKKDSRYAEHVLRGMLAFFDRYDVYTNGKYHDEVEMMKSREYYSYFLRTNNTTEAYRTAYFKQYGPRKKRFIRRVKMLLRRLYDEQ